MKAPARADAPTRAVPAPPDLPSGFLRRWARVTRFILSHRLYTPRYILLAFRFVRFKITHPHVITEGFVFFGPRVQIQCKRGSGRLTLGRWVTIGPGNALRCHEGTLRIGDKCVLGGDNTINCYLDIEVGPECIFAGNIHITDFDHRYDDLTVPIRKQGLVKSPVKVGANCWIGEKVAILRGVTVGEGSVIAAHAVVNRDVPPNSVVGGVPARVLKRRGEHPQRG